MTQKRAVSIREFSEQMDWSQDTTRRLIASGDIRAYRYGPKLIRIDVEELHRMRRPYEGSPSGK